MSTTPQVVLFEARNCSRDGSTKPRYRRPTYDGCEARLRNALRLIGLWGFVAVAVIDNANGSMTDLLVLCHGLVGTGLFGYAKHAQLLVDRQLAGCHVGLSHEKWWFEARIYRCSTSRTRWQRRRAHAVSGTEHMAYACSVGGKRFNVNRVRRSKRGLEFLR